MLLLNTRQEALVGLRSVREGSCSRERGTRPIDTTLKVSLWTAYLDVAVPRREQNRHCDNTDRRRLRIRELQWIDEGAVIK